MTSIAPRRANPPAPSPARSAAAGSTRLASRSAEAAGGGREKITKIEAVRRALAHMGRKAKPADMQPYIKSEFGIEMTTDHISTYKGDILKKQKKGKRVAAAVRRAATEPQAPASRAPQARNGGADHVLLDDVLTVKGLLDRVGPDRLHKLIDGLTERQALESVRSGPLRRRGSASCR